MNAAAELFYTESHEWIRIEGEKAYWGITDYAQEHLGDIVFVELPEADIDIEAGDRLAVIESVKAVSDVYTPLSGTIILVNEDLETSPELLNEDPYENYIAVIAFSDISEKEKLMSVSQYEAFCQEEDKK
ncbi:MAG: glycine cleavage system protein GcvH [Syntrophomonadaceae bacterium]|jgi:glycine cleavage system H protein|nr:glycine cleavage system protein GcvH [Syntrophomonadaceae bacterium]